MTGPDGAVGPADEPPPERSFMVWLVLAGALSCFPLAMIVYGVATDSARWPLAAGPAAIFFGAGLRVSWLRAQTFVDLFDGSDESVARHDAARAIGWTLVSLAGVAGAILTLRVRGG